MFDVLSTELGDRAWATRPRLLAEGFSDRDISRALRTTWMRARTGVYVRRDHWASLGEPGRHLLRADACLDKLGDRVALSHWTALVARGLAPDGVNLGDVQLIRLDGGAGRTESGVTHHEASRRHVPVQLVDGRLVVGGGYAVRQTATVLDKKRTLGLLDAAYHLGITDAGDQRRLDPVCEPWPGNARFRLVAPLANALVESYGETYVRWICHRFGLPIPEPQVDVVDEHGLVGRADHWWLGGRLLGEFDGKAKYTDYLREGETSVDVFQREKRRGRRLEDTGAMVLRFDWNDVLDRNEARTAERIRHRLEMASRLELPRVRRA